MQIPIDNQTKACNIVENHAKSCLQGCSGEADTNWGGGLLVQPQIEPKVTSTIGLKANRVFQPGGGVYYCDPFTNATLARPEICFDFVEFCYTNSKTIRQGLKMEILGGEGGGLLRDPFTNAT